MPVKFLFDHFGCLTRIFEARYPSRHVLVRFSKAKSDWDGIAEAQGKGLVLVSLDVDQNFESLVDTYIHELAHAAVGPGAGHSKRHKASMASIRKEYYAQLGKTHEFHTPPKVEPAKPGRGK